MLQYRAFHEEDLHFFKQCAQNSPDWIKEESDPDELSDYMKRHEMYQGEWRIWEKNGIPLAISFLAEWVPSNEKAWLGTILVHPDFRGRGTGKEILSLIGKELRLQGHKVLFAGVPEARLEWIRFLSAGGFEQYKLEKIGDKEYMVLIFPL
ncbi:N-acetyltransferase family protein [Metabacillus sp. 84]|uniref:GNAT family N-acetyltransferase n=1 Tax=unclassified Metabacillus TaxID=2675274 RepID=UPI003CE8D69A